MDKGFSQKAGLNSFYDVRTLCEFCNATSVVYLITSRVIYRHLIFLSNLVFVLCY